MRNRRLIASAAVPIVLAAAGCDGGGADRLADRVVSIEIAEPASLLPTDVQDPSGRQVLSGLFTPLAGIDRGGLPYEAAAEKIESTDNRVWTITLRDGFTFHNGEKVTADSYLAAWNFGAYGPHGQFDNYLFERIEGYPALNPTDPDGTGPRPTPTPAERSLSGLRKLDDRTFRVTLTQPYREFEAALSFPAFYPLPSAAFEPGGAVRASYGQAPIGNGPFAMSGPWQHDQKIEIRRYPGYAGPQRPAVGGVLFKVYDKPESAYADVVAGRLDVLRRIPTAKLAHAAADLGNRVQRAPSSAIQLLAFPTFDPAFGRPEVRKAISMAIDRDEIATKVFHESQHAATSFVPPVVAGYRADTCGDACVFNPTKARALYASAGGPPRLTISYNVDGGHHDWVEATCAQLRANLGVECIGQGEPKFADLLAKVARRQPVGAFRLGWVMDYPSMESYLSPLYSTAGSSNYYGYSNAEFDNLVRAGAAAATAEEAIRKYQLAEDLLARDLPIMPLRYGQNTVGYSAKVRNVTVDPYSVIDVVKLEWADS